MDIFLSSWVRSSQSIIHKSLWDSSIFELVICALSVSDWDSTVKRCESSGTNLTLDSTNFDIIVT